MDAPKTCPTCGGVVTQAIAQRSLPVPVRPSIRGIAHDVARRRMDVTVDEIFMGGRERRIVTARHEVMWEGRKAGWSYPMIARRFPSPSPKREFMDHTSVIFGVSQHAKRRRQAIMALVASDNARSASRHGLRFVDGRA